MAEALAKGKEVLNQSVWEACAGSTVKTPQVGSLAYYFPRGHADYAFGLLHFPSCRTAITEPYLCKIKDVKLLVSEETEEVYTVVELDPSDGRPEPPQNPPPHNLVRFSSKFLEPEDARGSRLRIPEACVEQVFPPLDMSQTPPSQALRVRDLLGNVWPFEHRYGGGPGLHCLAAGWRDFADSKRLRPGDTVVFMKNAAGELLVGLRRRPPNSALRFLTGEGLRREYGPNIAAEDVVAAVRLADRGLPFKVAYYPRVGWPSFILSKATVESALRVPWPVGLRVRKGRGKGKMASGSVTRFCVDEKCVSWPWKCLEVCWDEPRVVEMVSPWEVALAEELKRNEVNPAPPAVLPGCGSVCITLFGKRIMVGVEGSGPDLSNLPVDGSSGEFKDNEMKPPSSAAEATVFSAAASQCSLPADGVSAEFKDFASDSAKREKMEMNPSASAVEAGEGSSLDQSSLPAGGCGGFIKLFGNTVAVGDPTAVNSCAPLNEGNVEGCI